MPDSDAPTKQGSPAWLRRVLTPPQVGESGGLPQWRERMFFFTLGPVLILGLMAYVMSLPMLQRGGHFLVMALDSFMLVLSGAVFLLRRVALSVRVTLLLLMIYATGLATLITIGPLSSGPLWLFMIPILAALFLGRRPALVGLGLNMAILLVITWLYRSGQLSWPLGLVVLRDRWPTIASSFLLTNAATALPVAILVHGLETSLGRQRQAAQELARERALLSQEIAQRRRAQEALAASEQLYRLLADNVSDIIWIIDSRSLSLTYVSPAVRAVLGYTPEQAAALGPPRMLTPASLAHANQIVKEELARDPHHPDPHRSRTAVVEAVRADGEKVWLEITGRFLRDQQGRPKAMLSVARDISERRRTEEALRSSEQRYRDLFESITDLIYTQDLQGRFLGANQASVAILGCPPEELIGRKGSDFMPPEHRQVFESQYLPTVQEKGFVSGLSQYLDRKGQKHYLEYRSTLVRPQEGEPYISGVGRDVTDRVLARRRLKRLEDQLAQSQKLEAVGTLAGGIAHDFNNVLAAMLGYTELVLADLPPDSSHRSNLEQVMKAGERAKGMVRQILSFSRRGESGQRPVRVQPLVVEALELLRTTLPATVEVDSRLDAPREMVMADPSQVHQVVVNLATNAFQAMGSAGGTLTVELETVELGPEQAAAFAGLRPGPYLRLGVSDTGHGMDSETMRRIFEPFFTTKQNGQGSGMGLAVVHGIVKNHGGEITVQSQPGRGARFQVYLPRLAQAPAPAPARREPEGGQGGGERLLLVDDEAPVGQMGRQVLERLGYRVTLCSSGQEALAVLQDTPQGFDLVITDLTMPRLTGDHLAARIMEINPCLPVVIATGYGGQIPRSGLPPNVRLLLSKPYSGNEIARAVRRALEALGEEAKEA